MNLPESVTIDGIRYKRMDRIANRVSCHVMYDCHLFRELKGGTVDEIIEDWRRECASPDDRYGAPYLCPVVVLEDRNEIRRVGSMVFPAHNYRTQAQVNKDVTAFRDALLADSDVVRLLAERTANPTTAEPQSPVEGSK